MKKKASLYSLLHIASGIFMVLTLLWLTISTPFVYAGQQAKKEVVEKKAEQKNNNNNPFSNTTEEKPENSNTSLSEYLHELFWQEHSFITITTYYKCRSSDLYFAFHPERLSPPPEA